LWLHFVARVRVRVKIRVRVKVRDTCHALRTCWVPKNMIDRWHYTITRYITLLTHMDIIHMGLPYGFNYGIIMAFAM